MKTKNKSFKRLFAFLVALVMVTALVPSVIFAADPTFTDVKTTDWFYKNVENLAAKDVVSGYKGTKEFKPNNAVTRQEAAKMIALGAKTPEATKTEFTDLLGNWADPYIMALEADGAVSGFNGTKEFKPLENIKRGHVAKMIALAFGLAEGSKAYTLTDIKGVDNEEYIKILASNGIVSGFKGTTEFKPNELVTRAQMAKMIDEAMELDVRIVEAKSINAKTIEVIFNKTVDSSKATVELFRGTSKHNVTLNWADDKQSVQLVGAGNFPAATYTVKVSGLTEEPLTAELKIEAQKVVSIEILSDIAVANKPLDAGVFPKDTEATVGYKVYDQYGEDISKTTPLTTNDTANIAAANGKVTISNIIAGKKVGDLVPVVLVHSATGVTAVETVKLSATPAVTAIGITGIFDNKLKEANLDDLTKVADGYYLVLELTDQYGDPVTDTAKAADLLVTNTDPSIVTLAPSITKLTVGTESELVLKVDSISKAGSTTVILISPSSGQTATYVIEVAETTTSDAITANKPAEAIADEDVLIPLTVLDKAGNLITDLNLLSKAGKGIKQGPGLVLKKDLKLVDGQVYYNAGKLAEGYHTFMFTSSTYKTSLVTFEVDEKAVPTAVRGFKDPLVLKVDGEKKVEWADVNVDDQYGRTMTSTALTASSATLKVEIGASETVVSLSGVTLNGVKKGTAVVTLSLDAVANSAVEQTVRVTDGNEYSGYEIEDIGLVQASHNEYDYEGNLIEEESYSNPIEFTVNGLLNGGKVELDIGDEYTAEVVGMGEVGNPFDVLDWLLDTISLSFGRYTYIDTEFTLRVTINATGQVLEKKFTVSDEEPVTESFFFTTEKDKYALAKPVTQALVKSDDWAYELKSNEEVPADLYIASVDQYGNKALQAIQSDSFDKIRIVPEVVGQVSIYYNGTGSAYATLAGDLTEAKVTMTFELGNASVTIPVLVVAGD